MDVKECFDVEDAEEATVSSFVEDRSTNCENSRRSSSNLDLQKRYIDVPIVGFEVMEERAKFTVFKLRVHNKLTSQSWMIYRRYTDFQRLYEFLRKKYPRSVADFPKKRWFGNNFDTDFLAERAKKLQKFLDDIVCVEELIAEEPVQVFLCLNDLIRNFYIRDNDCDYTIISNSPSSECLFHSFSNELESSSNLNALISNNLPITMPRCVQIDLLDFIRNEVLNCGNCGLKLKRYEHLVKFLDSNTASQTDN